MALSVSGATAQTPLQPNGVEPEQDLRTVILLAGYPCKTVAEFLQPSPTDYHVSCDTDGQYRIHISEREAVHVTRQSDSLVIEPRDQVSHEKIMKKHLTAIVNLGGHDCAGVLGYEHHDPKDTLVTCEDGTVYRIHVTPESRVEVERSQGSGAESQ